MDPDSIDFFQVDNSHSPSVAWASIGRSQYVGHVTKHGLVTIKDNRGVVRTYRLKSGTYQGLALGEGGNGRLWIAGNRIAAGDGDRRIITIKDTGIEPQR